MKSFIHAVLNRRIAALVLAASAFFGADAALAAVTVDTDRKSVV